MQTNTKKRIIVAPLNWGLGHATRCIPIIKALENLDFEPIIASDGIALQLLKKEFPHLVSFELPSYQIRYATSGSMFKLKLVVQIPHIIKTIVKEKWLLHKLIKSYNINGVISDNRLGLFTKKIPTVFITHQLRVLSGQTTGFSSFLHRFFINKFMECWVPDVATKPNLSGKLGHLDTIPKHVKYIGPLSRLHKRNLPLKYDVFILLSGPEPQRTLLEEKLIKEINSYTGSVLFVKGKVEDHQKIVQKDSITFYNFMTSEQLETAFNESDKIICRSGYTTIMDLAILQKKALFIPTPGQYEQEYLAQKFHQEAIIPYSKQHKFKISKIDQIDFFQGFQTFQTKTSWNNLFKIFQ